MIGNPVLHKELFMRLRLRQVPLPVKIGVALLVFVSLGLLYYFMARAVLDTSGASNARGVWQTCMWLQLIAVLLFAPVVTANCITQEKEQQTWEMLIATRLKPSEVVFGKLVARLAVILLILALFLPITLFGWINSVLVETQIAFSARLTELSLSYAVLLITAVFFATFGLYMSWQVKRTLAAIMLSYTFAIGFLLIGTFLVFIALQFRFTDSTFLVKCPILWVNPAYLMAYGTSPDRAENSTLFVVYGLLVYAVGTLALLWRMILGFFHFSYDDDAAPPVGERLRGMARRAQARTTDNA
ncbi:MAG TPA: hypothetical protein VKT77_02960 [Chthonomonadaceae bacterium]|nr:hypothetical protein [Chthonomonadaceae bacterium]